LAVSKNQRMVTCGRNLLEVKRIVYLGVTFWAWMASIAVHLIVLAVFGLVKFSQSKTQLRDVPIPTATVSQVKKLIEAAPIIPKPKIKKPGKAEFAGVVNSAAHKLTAGRIFVAAKPGNGDLRDLAKSYVSQSVSVLLRHNTRWLPLLKAVRQISS